MAFDNCVDASARPFGGFDLARISLIGGGLWLLRVHAPSCPRQWASVGLSAPWSGGGGSWRWCKREFTEKGQRGVPLPLSPLTAECQIQQWLDILEFCKVPDEKMCLILNSVHLCCEGGSAIVKALKTTTKVDFLACREPAG